MARNAEGRLPPPGPELTARFADRGVQPDTCYET